MAQTAREIALLALSACEKQGAWSDGYLKKALRDSGLDSRDAALATRIYFGVLQNRMLLDFYIAQFSSVSPEKLENKVLCALRTAAYQICFMDRVPQSAAVNESVTLTRKYAKNPRAAGLVNAVLRRLTLELAQLPHPSNLATQYSHPEWLVKEFSFSLGNEVEEALLANNSQPPTFAQINTLKASAEDVMASLTASGVTVKAHPWLDNCLILTGTGNIEALPAFQQGFIYVQDAAARLAVLAAEPESGMRILDTCASPGGKSFASAIAMGGKGEIISCDIHPHKERLIQAGAERLGLSILTPMTQDAKTDREAWHRGFDIVLADVPCSGLGIIRKKPDIRYKDPAPLAGLPAVQRAILENVSRYVRSGGVLLYATCTVLERENEAVVREFIERHNDFTLEPLELPEPLGTVREGMVTLWPHRHGTDGFFFAKMRRSI
jgi:16S rRNA (cytosine967-C5)-methyltransferase